MNFDKDHLARQLFDGLVPDFREACLRKVDDLSQLCESPIEILFGATFWLALRAGGGDVRICHGPAYEKAALEVAHIILIPQYNWKEYRIDWVLKTKRTTDGVFIECDGHDFHERTKEQAERDRSKDRAIQLAGIPILRFTGREIHRDAQACVVQALNMLTSVERKIPKTVEV